MINLNNINTLGDDEIGQFLSQALMHYYKAKT